MQPQTVTLIVAGLGITGTLVGVSTGHLLFRSWQREQWMMDQRRQEYRELLSAISSAYMAMIRFDEVEGTLHYTRELADEVAKIKLESFRVLRDRIFIAQELAWEDMLGQWDGAVSNYEAGKMVRIFADRFTAINERLVHMALHPPKRRSAFRKWRDRREVRKFRAENSLP